MSRSRQFDAIKMGQLPLPGFRMTGEEVANYPHEVRVYRNLHTPKGSVKYSVKDMKANRVIAHTDDITLDNARGVINEGGRQRVIKEGKKNVHAFLEGTPTTGKMQGGEDLTYNPFKYDSFVDKGTEAPVNRMSQVRLGSQEGRSTVRYRA